MSRYRIVVRETVTRTTEVNAASLQDAREIAEEQDWRTWPVDPEGESDSEIVDVVYVSDDEEVAS